ncbi:MAG: VOC family protein [Planctomycetota bacterium]
MVGSWEGAGTVPAGDAEQSCEGKFIFGGRYLQCTSVSIADGDYHEDVGFFSFDQARERFVYRAFHSEGFINTYLAEIIEEEGGTSITLTAESIENAPPGMKCEETIHVAGSELKFTLSVAMGEGPHEQLVSGELQRVSRVKGVDKITIAVDDMEASVKFYSNLLAAEFEDVELAGFTLKNADTGSFEILLCPRELAQVHEDINNNTVQVRFVIEDVESAHERGLADGGTEISAPAESGGRVQSGLRDPDGNSIELTSG